MTYQTYQGFGPSNASYSAQEVATLLVLARTGYERERIEYKLKQQGGQWAAMTDAQAVQIVAGYGGCTADGTLTDLGRGHALTLLNRQAVEGF